MSGSTDPIYKLLQGLPQSSITTGVLSGLDYLAPGQWKNTTVFSELITETTGETDPATIQAIGARALALYTDPKQGYQRAVWCFQTVDSVDKTVVAASAMNLIGEKLGLGFLTRFTPKPETAQAVDAAVKFACELSTFCLTNGLPGDSVADFSKAVVNYSKEDSMRLTAFVALDCVLPLGPNFMDKLMTTINGLDASSLSGNKLFAAVAQYLPGDLAAQHALVKQNLAASASHLSAMASTKGISQAGVLEKIRQYVAISDDKLDVIAAGLDMSTNYFEHTGIQTVARRVISRAYAEI